MSRPRKSWEPEYRFGGRKGDAYLPNPLGENKTSHLYNLRTKPKHKAKKK